MKPTGIFVVALVFLCDLAPASVNAANLTLEQQNKADHVNANSLHAKKRADHFKATFDGTQNTYGMKMDALAEENKAAVDTLVIAIAEKHKTMIKLCKTTSSSEDVAPCNAFSEKYQQEVNIEAKSVADRTSGKAKALIESHLNDLVLLEIDCVNLEQELRGYLSVIVEYEHDPSLAAIIKADKKNVELQIQLTGSWRDELSNLISSYNEILYGSICFEFQGVAKTVGSQARDAFIQEAKVALELAFAEKRVEIVVVAADILSQDFSQNPQNPKRRGLRPIYSHGKLRVQFGVGYRCTCVDDTLTSDLYKRRDLAKDVEGVVSSSSPREFRRDLWQSELDIIFGDIMRNVFDSVDNDLYTAQMVPCSTTNM